MTPPVRHPLYHASVQADLVFHASMCGVGLLQLTAGLLLLLSPDPSDAPFHMLLSLAPLTVSMVASSATLRLWRQTPPNRVPTHGEALLALASSLPLMGVTLIGVLGGAWTAYARGDARPWRQPSPSCLPSTSTDSFLPG
ncbi:hypothetical protein [Deinococcus multiflagellatus]|uniref:hypothetical protein n=1 Tax=Deinococcus multiflagellatus TaxID=1656887 RepID=UPI0036D20952